MNSEIVRTIEHPWVRFMKVPSGYKVIHPNQREIRQENGYPSGDIVTYKCNICGTEWEEELPQ